MAHVLFIKTSSLGDVIHHMPALVDAAEACPDTAFSWVVEETFAPLVRLHPAVGEVIPVAWRRWRKSLYRPVALKEIGSSLRALHSRRYDDVVDTQGLLRSALIAAAARGRRHGYNAESIREPLASLLYTVRHSVSRQLHAVERNRILSGLALGYTPQGAPRFGLDREQLRSAGKHYAVLLHATAREEKLWAEANWVALGKTLGAGIELVLPWGNERERERSERLAATLPAARVPPAMTIDGIARMIAGAEFVVGVDTGLLHLAAALGVPLVAIFAGSQPALTGPVGSGLISVLGSDGASPSSEAVLRAVEKIRLQI
ncbi:MAG TPA: lipopolysaccharide heptosyltransferase I [Pseudolabrys sp.]|nr:lipopolysaccharide heptosyltransferase I [Pseudolabrys sp.]